MGLKKTVLLVASLNFGYFAVELSFSQVFNSLSLLSDSLDFLEDSAINLLIFLAFAWSALARKRLSYLLALILLIPGAVFIAEAISKFNEPIVPNGFGMSVIGLGALFVNVFCAFILTKHKSEEGGLASARHLLGHDLHRGCRPYAGADLRLDRAEGRADRHRVGRA